MIAGVGDYEQNAPNTFDSCNDQSAAVYQQDESIDRIVVKSKDGGTMTAGTTLEIRATVSTAVDVSTRTNSDLYETAHMYYLSESKGTWQYICTEMSPPGVGKVTFSCDFEIPEDNYYENCGSSCGFQLVRVNYGYGEYAIEACTETGIWVSLLSIESFLPRYKSQFISTSVLSLDRMCNTPMSTIWCSSWLPPSLRQVQCHHWSTRHHRPNH